ncbi:BamA/TamA family outer membrane protein [Gemmatimonadota bacterium]
MKTLLLLALLSPGLTIPQDTFPPDTYADPGARALVEAAMAARESDEGEILSYEGLLRERIYIGFAGLTFRRERSLLERERVARFRWSRDEGKSIQWMGLRQEVPIAGRGDQVEGGVRVRRNSVNLGVRVGETEDSAAAARDIQEEFLQEYDPGLFLSEPGSDRLGLGSEFALNPLADTAGYYYRYRSGDTLRIELPTENRTITLVEVLVEPRRAAFELLAGSLWFDRESGVLARASYRPSKPYDVEDQEEGGSDVPGIFKPVQVDFDYFTLEYSLQEFRWWLPRRFAMEGEVRIGKIMRLPLIVESTLVGTRVNQEESELFLEGTPLPEGWIREVVVSEEEGEEPDTLLVIVPPVDSLYSSSALSEDFLGPSPVAFSREEMDQLASELRQLMPSYYTLTPRLNLGWASGLHRFNRVEGLSLGMGASLDLSPMHTVRAEARLGVVDLAPRGELALDRGPVDRRLSLAAYRRLGHTADFQNPLSTGASLSNLLFRNDLVHFYQSTGVELRHYLEGRRSRRTLSLFAEEHEAVEKETDFYLWRPFTGDTLPSVISAREGAVYGMAGDLRWQWGVDPHRFVVSGLLRGEVTGGDFPYQRTLATVALSRPLFGGTALALEVGGGSGWGELPIQKEFYLGGSRTLRGYGPSEFHGESFWMTRAEVGTGLPALRLVAFTDLGWAGPRDSMMDGKALWSAGAGISLLDGILRLDTAWPLRGGDGLRFYMYLDGLF